MVIEIGYVRCEIGRAYSTHGRQEIIISIVTYLKCVTLGELGVFLIRSLFMETLSSTDNIINISYNICTL